MNLQLDSLTLSHEQSWDKSTPFVAQVSLWSPDGQHVSMKLTPAQTRHLAEAVVKLLKAPAQEMAFAVAEAHFSVPSVPLLTSVGEA